MLRRLDIEGRAHLLCSVRDIDARKRIEEALRASEERFATIFNGTATILAFTEPVGGIVDVNEAWVQGTGYTRDEVIGKSGRELGLWTHPEDRNRIATKRARRGARSTTRRS